MKTLLLLIALSSLSLFGQQTNTVYLQMATGLTAMPANPYYDVTNNIGQNYHTFSIISSGATGTSCWDAPIYRNFVAVVEVSYDGVHYTTIPQVRVSYVEDDLNNDSSSKFYRSIGAYPYIRLHILHFPDSMLSGCSISIGYTGSLNSSTLSDGQNYLGSDTIYANTNCTAVNIGGLIDTDSPIIESVVGLLVNGSATDTTTKIYTDSSTCSTTPVMSITGTADIPVDSNMDPLFQTSTVQSDGYIRLWVESSATSTIVARLAILN